MNPFWRNWRLSRLQILFGVLMGIFLLAMLGVIVYSYQSGQGIRVKTSQDTEILATIANIQRHGLLLHVETLRLTGDSGAVDWEGVQNQRAFLDAQLRVLTPLAKGLPLVDEKVTEIRSSLAQYDEKLEAAMQDPAPNLVAFQQEVTPLLDTLERDQVKVAYDLAEREFLSVLSESLNAQQFAQQFLIGLGFLFLVMVMGVGVWLVRTSQAAYETQQTQVGLLEKAVAERTKSITLTGDVTRRISSILNRRQLAEDVVQQLQTAFGYYHAHIYLLDESGETLHMAGGTGEAGQVLLAQGHKIPRGKGLVGRAAETREPVLVSDTSQDPDWLPNPLLPETKAEVAMPIIANEEVLGVLDVQNNQAGSLSANDVETIHTIADQVGIALQNIRSNELTAKRAAELQTVSVISTATATIRDADEMLATVVRLTQRRFGLYHAHIFTFDSRAQELEVVACGWKESDEHEGTHGLTRIPLGQEQSLVARAARTKQPVVVNDVYSDPGWLPNAQLPDTRAEMAVPLMIGEQLLGVLDVQADHPNAFTQDDVNIKTTLAAQVAVAYDNARSYAKAQSQAERQAEISRLTQRIQSAGTVAEALQVAAREIGRVAGKKATLVALTPPSTPAAE